MMADAFVPPPTNRQSFSPVCLTDGFHIQYHMYRLGLYIVCANVLSLNFYSKFFCTFGAHPNHLKASSLQTCGNVQIGSGGGTMCGKTTRAYLMFRICETSQSPYSMCKSWRILYLPNHVTYTQFHFLLQICSGFLFEGSAKSSLLETANIYTQHCVSPEPKIHMYMIQDVCWESTQFVGLFNRYNFGSQTTNQGGVEVSISQILRGYTKVQIKERRKKLCVFRKENFTILHR